jgi:hypothetical protein
VDAINGINGGCLRNTYTFTFTITNWRSADFGALGFAIHGGGSQRLLDQVVIGADGTANQPDPNDPAVQACGTPSLPSL